MADIFNLQNVAGAFEPFFDRLCAYSGLRREEDRVRRIDQSVHCSVSDGSLADPFGESVAPTGEQNYMVEIPSSEWLDHLPPQTGDEISVEGFPAMRVVNVVPPMDGLSYTLECRSRRRL